MSDAAERDVMKQTMLEDDDVLKNKSNSSESCLDVKNSNGLPDLNQPLEPLDVKNSDGLPDLNEPLKPVAVSRDTTYPHNVKNSNGLPDLNEPLEPVAVSRDITYPHSGKRKNIDVEGQRLEKSKIQTRTMILETGYGTFTPIYQVHLLSSNGAFQPRRDPVTDHSKVKFSEEKAYGKLKVGSKRPQVSSDGYLGSSSVASNAPRLNNIDTFDPWSLFDSPWENPMSNSSWENPMSNPFMNIDTQARGTGSSFEMNSHVPNGLYQGVSSGSKQPVFSQSFQNLQGPRKQEWSAGSPLPNGWVDLTASTNQFMDWTDTSASAHKGFWSSSYYNNANMGRLDMINSQIKRDRNIPFDPSVSFVNQHGPKAFIVDEEKRKKAAEFRHQRKLKMKMKTRALIDSKALPSFENKGESSHEKPSSTDAEDKGPMTSSNDEGNRDESSSEG